MPLDRLNRGPRIPVSPVPQAIHPVNRNPGRGAPPSFQGAGGSPAPGTGTSVPATRRNGSRSRKPRSAGSDREHGWAPRLCSRSLVKGVPVPKPRRAAHNDPAVPRRSGSGSPRSGQGFGRGAHAPGGDSGAGGGPIGRMECLARLCSVPHRGPGATPPALAAEHPARLNCSQKQVRRRWLV